MFFFQKTKPATPHHPNMDTTPQQSSFICQQDTSFGMEDGTTFVVPGGAVVHLISILTSAALITTLPAYSALPADTSWGWGGEVGLEARRPQNFFSEKRDRIVVLFRIGR